jgi:hypothetical protein
MKVIVSPVFALLFLTYGCFAQSEWTSVRELKAGTRVVVVERSGAESTGRVARVDDIALTLDKGRAISRDSVARLYLTKRGSIMKRALIGAIAGAGIGTALGVIATVATKSDGLAAAGGFLYGIPVGAAIGAATVGRKRGRLIYESR